MDINIMVCILSSKLYYLYPVVSGKLSLIGAFFHCYITLNYYKNCSILYDIANYMDKYSTEEVKQLLELPFNEKFFDFCTTGVVSSFFLSMVEFNVL